METLKYLLILTLFAFWIETNSFAQIADSAVKNAIIADNTDILQKFKLEDKPIKYIDDSKTTSLMFAAKENSIASLRWLLNHVGDVNSTNDDGFTALHFAVNNYCTDAIFELVDYGADVNIQSPTNLTTPIHIATKNKKKHAVALLIELGANVNVKDMKGITPLMIAAMNGDKEMVELLLNSGAETKYTSHDGKSALQHAKSNGFKNIIALLTGGNTY